MEVKGREGQKENEVGGKNVELREGDKMRETD